MTWALIIVLANYAVSVPMADKFTCQIGVMAAMDNKPVKAAFCIRTSYDKDGH